jgi:peptidoglycan hydrolase-like protein with peptidoglycan-binding domain
MNKTTITQAETTTALAYCALAAVSLIASLATVTIAHAEIVTQLDLGSQNADVTELQTYLAQNTTFYPSGLVTGYFGSLTEAAVQKFQISEGLISSGDPASTGFGRVGPATLARLSSMMNGSVPGVNSGDLGAPVIYPATVSVGVNEAVISWTTSESAIGRIMYSTEPTFVYSTARSTTATGYGVVEKIVLTDLKPNTTYYYVRESVDKAGNIAWGWIESFKTE